MPSARVQTALLRAGVAIGVSGFLFGAFGVAAVPFVPDASWALFPAGSVVIGAAAAVLFRSALRRTSDVRWKRFLGHAVLGILVGTPAFALLAYTLVPLVLRTSYRIQGERGIVAFLSILSATALSIPLAAALGAACAPQSDARDTATPRPNRRRVAIIVAAALVLCVGATRALTGEDEWDFRRALPADVTDVHQAFAQPAFTGDYEYCLRARLSQDDFTRYVTQFGLTPHAPDRNYSQPSDPWLGWGCMRPDAADWWNPTPDLADTFVAQQHDEWVLAKYQHGYLYLHAIDH